MKRYILVFVIAVLVLSACSQKEQDKTAGQLMVTTTAKNTTVSRTVESKVGVAESFVKTLIEQSFDQTALKTKEEQLRNYAGDSSLDDVIKETSYLQSELIDYQLSNHLTTSASVTLVEREITDMTVYYNETAYFVDVSYVESSPAYNGSFDRRKQYTFTLKDDKVYQFEEVIAR